MKIIFYTNSEDPHADLMEEVFLNRGGVKIYRINTDKFFNDGSFTIKPTHYPILHMPFKDIHLDEVNSIWYRRPIKPVIDAVTSRSNVHDFCSREGEAGLLGVLLNIKNVNWINHPICIQSANNKSLQLTAASKLGFKIPQTIISNNQETVKAFVNEHPLGVIYKPLTYGAVDLDENTSGAIYATRIKLTEEVLRGISLAPGIYQELLPKRCDIRVTIFGHHIFSVAIDSSEFLDDVDVRMRLLELEHKPVKLPPDVESACFKLLERFGLLFGAIDIVETKCGEYYFLELNPNGQWGWIEKKTNLPLSKSLADLLIAPRV